MSLDANSKYYVCKEECAENEVKSLEDSKICIAQSKCTGFIHEQQCVKKCPDSTFQENANSKYCLPECTNEYPVYVKNGDSAVCTRTCPDDLPITLNGQCVSECEGILSQKRECKKDCAGFSQPVTINHKQYNMCVETCQGNYPYV